ncbi:hypothetical protein T11_80 [Trichinella zimbabwensis]|uniref:Uncharacterized protein n=1 Tax=Trichinella zimbabwensis TaxID=268475 RepID=A0A0V1HX70_9BILA|nr:hypothetical protein T11_80 [Trichinella zimbabwensis]
MLRVRGNGISLTQQTPPPVKSAAQQLPPLTFLYDVLKEGYPTALHSDECTASVDCLVSVVCPDVCVKTCKILLRSFLVSRRVISSFAIYYLFSCVSLRSLHDSLA